MLSCCACIPPCHKAVVLAGGAVLSATLFAYLLFLIIKRSQSLDDDVTAGLICSLGGAFFAAAYATVRYWQQHLADANEARDADAEIRTLQGDPAFQHLLLVVAFLRSVIQAVKKSEAIPAPSDAVARNTDPRRWEALSGRPEYSDLDALAADMRKTGLRARWKQTLRAIITAYVENVGDLERLASKRQSQDFLVRMAVVPVRELWRRELHVAVQIPCPAVVSAASLGPA